MKNSMSKRSKISKQLGYLPLVMAGLILAGCGSSELLDKDADIDTLIPEPPVELPNRPSPSENAAVIATSSTQIFDASTNAILLRGVNLQYGDNPEVRIAGIAAIKETGANVVRLQLRANTTADQLEAALDEIVANGMIAMPMLWEGEGEITCTESSEFIEKYTQELWFDRWIDVLVKDKYQPHLMINIANEWGPMNVWDANSVGYAEYIDVYKAIIREFRSIGFRVPLVIDAPHCGQDYNAFLADRALELQAADVESNIVLSVHAYGAQWNSSNKIVSATDLLSKTGVPFIIGEFGGSGVFGATSIDHTDLITKGVGDKALVFNLPWVTTEDKSAYSFNLETPMDMQGVTLSADIYTPVRYVEEGHLGVQMYLRDGSDRYASFGVLQANDSDLKGNAWTHITYAIDSMSDLAGYADEGFDIADVSKIGLEIMANGKAVNYVGDIKLDNLKLQSGGVTPPMYLAEFSAEKEGWAVAWTGGTIETRDTALAISQDWTSNNQLAMTVGGGVANLDTSAPLTISAKVFIPAEYAGETNFFFKFFIQHGDGWAWVDTGERVYADINVGEWNDITFENVDFTAAGTIQVLGIQLGGITTAKTEPLLLDSVTVLGAGQSLGGAAPPSYHAKFVGETEGWGKDWTSGTNVSVDGDNLVITQDWTQGDQFAVFVGGGNTDIDTSGLLTAKMNIFIPADYANESGIYFKIYVNHGDSWAWGQTSDKGFADITPGEWNEITFEGVDWTSFGALKKLGIQFGGVTTAHADPILVDYVAILEEGQSMDGGGAQLGQLVVYGAEFVGETQGWAKDWTAGTVLSTDDDNLIVTQDWGLSDQFAITAGAADINIDTSKPVSFKVKLFLPQDYAAESGIYFKVYTKHGDSWAWGQTNDVSADAFTPGAWNEIVFSNLDWSSFGELKALGLQFGGITSSHAEPITIDYIRAEQEGLVPVELDTLLNMSFTEQSDADAWTLDYAEGGFTAEVLANAKVHGFGVVPYGWMAWSWKGNGETTKGLDMSTSESSVELTTRGNEIVNGPNGIKASSEPAGFGQ